MQRKLLKIISSSSQLMSMKSSSTSSSSWSEKKSASNQALKIPMKVVLESRQILAARNISASFKTLPIRPRVQWRGMMRSGSQENAFEPEQITNWKYIDKQVRLESCDLLIRRCLTSFFKLSRQTLSWHDTSLMSGRDEFPLPPHPFFLSLSPANWAELQSPSFFFYSGILVH